MVDHNQSKVIWGLIITQNKNSVKMLWDIVVALGFFLVLTPIKLIWIQLGVLKWVGVYLMSCVEVLDEHLTHVFLILNHKW